MKYSFFKNTFKIYNNKSVVLIYNMGKVGSSTLVNSIPKAYQIHTLYSDLPPSGLRIKNMPIKRNIIFFLNRLTIKLALKFRKQQTKIITVIRHPVDRNRSMFFQDLELWLTKHSLEKGGGKSDYNLDPLIKAYEQTFEHDFYLRWFKNELSRLTNIDIQKVKFDKGYDILENSKYKILFLKLEKLEENKKLIEEFLDIEISLENKNVAFKKWYGEVYAQFKNLPLMECEKKLLENPIFEKFGYK